MNIHKNARLTFTRRLEMVQDITERGLSQRAAALALTVLDVVVMVLIWREYRFRKEGKRLPATATLRDQPNQAR
jgi:uncharacterized membrane protein